ncbi:phosphotransferase [Nocardia aurea]|uniref:Phosphotransferase n=1 Tax=Nocardia aurea TaxID=2144174 RepID=A0ABV3FRM0_9NOCA
MDEPPVTRVRWSSVPSTVRTDVEKRLGARVRSAEDQSGGFSHGVAARLFLEDGSSVFVKAIDDTDELAVTYRKESNTAAALPHDVPTPRHRHGWAVDGWFVACFDDVTGRHPRLDNPGELGAVLATVTRLAETLTPCPLPDVPTFLDHYGPALAIWAAFAANGPPPDLDTWCRANLDRLAGIESAWHGFARGNTLLHTDLRPDNMIRRADGSVVVVDWAWPCRGAAWIDLVGLAPSLVRAGTDPDPLLASHSTTREVDPVAIDGLVCALAGYWTSQCRLPAPPRSPRLRRYQAEAAELTTTWLRRRLSAGTRTPRS